MRRGFRSAMLGMLLMAGTAAGAAAADTPAARPRDPNTPRPNLDSAGDDPEIGSHLRRRQTTVVGRDDIYAIREAHKMAACAVNKHRSDVRIMLDTTSADVIAKAHRNMYVNLECQSMMAVSAFANEQSLSQSEDVERGMLAEEMLPSRGALLALPPLPPQADYETPWVKVSGRNPATEEMAVCVTARNPTGVVGLLQTLPESDGERQAIGALSPWLGECLVTNAKLTANRQAIRAALAEALYHRVNALPSATASTAKR